MANGDDMSSTFDAEAKMAALGERVEGQGRRLTSLEHTVTQGFKQVEVSLGALSSEFRNSQRPQWQAIGVALTFATIVGALAYWPIRESTNDLKAQDIETARIIQSLASETAKNIQAIATTTVSRQEMDWRSARGTEDRSRIEAAIADIRAGLVPRAEHERVWANFDQRFVDQQRQLDELKKQNAELYGPRDFFKSIEERVDRLEHRTPPPS